MKTLLDIPYRSIDGRTLTLDVLLPGDGSKPVPAVLWVCGGRWRSSAKINPPDWLRDFGFAVIPIEYTASGQAIAPANIHDCKAAVRYVRANAGRLGIDPLRIGAFGASAGGHLVSLLGLSNGVAALEGVGDHLDVSSTVKAVCDFCGPSDMRRIAEPAVREKFPMLYIVAGELLGGPIEQRQEIADLMSPMSYVRPNSVPMLIVHGRLDTLVPVEDSIILHEALQRAGNDVTLRILEDGTHGWEPKVTQQDVGRFFQRTLA
jgi:acetyl esterase/lipase